MQKETKIQKLLDLFQGNAYPAMLEDFAFHLGVSADAVRRLAPGWVPIVEFSPKRIRPPHGSNAPRIERPHRSYCGWWALPERNAFGEVIGLALRNQADKKVMYPGSKHGLTYVVNPDHEMGGVGYRAGPDNWVRTMDAGILCPVCEKPDGCLVSSENPADPQAVICIRVRAGAERPMRLGYLHIRKQSGRLSAATPALGGDPDDWVLVVEGFSDTAAAETLGFTGVGRPSNLACMDMLRDLVRGRRVMIIGENDRKEDGSEPGREGMVAAFQVLSKVCHDCRMLMPPAHIKDLRAWVARYKLTRDELLKYSEKHGQEKVPERTLLDDDRPLTIARAILDDQYRMASRYLIRRWAGQWWRYSGTKYDPMTEEEFAASIHPWAHDKFVQQTTPKGSVSVSPLRVSTGVIANIAQAAVSETLVKDSQIPTWINGAEGPDPRDLVVFDNGILHVPAYTNENNSPDILLDLTPDLFTTAALPVPFDPTATCPTWRAFLRSSLGDDRAKIALLQEWFGYCMTTDTSMQKMMFLRGPSGAGKSVVLNILCRLVGQDQAASTSFSELTGPFGTQSLLGKLVCVIPDARTPRYGDHMRGLELLLNITSGDAVQINRKFKDPLERHQLTARISIASNEFLDVPDHSGAMMRRLNVIEFTRSFVGQEDWRLEHKLAKEIPGIAIWALEGLKRLRRTKAFTLPESSIEALREWRTSTSPMASFVEECCEVEHGGEIDKRQLYDAWVAWSRERRIAQISVSKFLERIRSAAPYARSVTYTKGGHKYSVFKGITLTPWAAKAFLGRPT